MGNYDNMKTIISGFSGNERIIAIPKVYIEITGEYHAAALLNQMIFWSDKTKRKDGYFYKTYSEWEEETGLTEYQVRRATNKLKALGLVDTKLKKANGSPTVHYHIKYEEVSDSILKKLKNRNQSNLGIETKETKESLTVDDSVNDSVDDYINKTVVDVERIPYREIIEYLNKKTGGAYKYKAASNRALIKKRWNEGNRLDDFKKVIEVKTEHANDPSNYFDAKFLRPSTLFGNKFDEYLNSAIVAAKPSKQEPTNWEGMLNG